MEYTVLLIYVYVLYDKNLILMLLYYNNKSVRYRIKFIVCNNIIKWYNATNNTINKIKHKSAQKYQ